MEDLYSQSDDDTDAEFVYCSKCRDIGYNDLIRITTKDGEVHWFCEECLEDAAQAESESSYISISRVPESDDDEEISSRKPKKNPTGDHKSGKNFMYSFAGFQGFKSGKQVWSDQSDDQIPAEPLIRPVWIGDFALSNGMSICRRMEGIFACLSSKSCAKVNNEVAQFEPWLQFALRPKSDVWPKSFQESGPTDDHIAVYFFPSPTEQERLHDQLIYEMIRDDLGMKATVQNAELLIFPSVLLPSTFWRFQGRLYLWGVFRGKKQVPLYM